MLCNANLSIVRETDWWLPGGGEGLEEGIIKGQEETLGDVEYVDHLD